MTADIHSDEYKKSCQIVKKVLQDKAQFAYFLGSYGTERFHRHSDVDIAAYFLPPLTFDQKLEASRDLEDHLGYEVDLIGLYGVDPIYARQVLETGRLIFSKDPEKLLIWKANILSVYPDFKKSREIIEKNLLRRKKHV